MNVPPPNSYDHNGFAATRSIQNYNYNGAGNPYSYGSYGGSSAYQAYEQQLRQYISEMQRRYSQTVDGSTRQEIQRNLNLAYQYLQQIGADLGMGGNSATGFASDPTGMGLGPDLGGQSASYPVSFQDSNHLVSEDGAEVSVTLDPNDTENRPVDFFQPHVRVVIPSNAARVTWTRETDESGKPTYVMKAACTNGKTFVYRFHDPEKIDVQAARKENVILDASLGADAKKVLQVFGLGEQAPEIPQPKGDPATSLGENGERIFDGESFHLSPVLEGENAETTVKASAEVTITPNNNTEYFTVEYDEGPPAAYIWKVYARLEDKEANPPLVKETITVDAALVNKIQFAGDPSRVEFLGELGDANDPHTINKRFDAADKLILTNDESPDEETALNPHYPDDSVPSRVENPNAYYEKDENITLHAYAEDDVNTHSISAGGTVDLYPNTQGDPADVSYDPATGKLTITLHTQDENGDPQDKIFILDAAMADRINLHLDPSKINYAGSLPKEIRDKIFDSGGKNVAGTEITDLPPVAQGLYNWVHNQSNPDLTLEAFLKALEDAGLTVDDLKNPSMPPDEKLLGFLRAIDTKLNTMLQNTELLKHVNDSAHIAARRAANDEFANLLGRLYLGVPVSTMHTNHPYQSYMTYLATSDDIKIGEGYFDLFDGSTGQVNFTSWALDTTVGHAEVDPTSGHANGMVSWYDPGKDKWMTEIADDYEAGDEGEEHHDHYSSITTDDRNAGNGMLTDYD